MTATFIKSRGVSRHRKAEVRVQPVAKTADSKGRVAIGSDFKNKHVIVEWISETEVLVKMARVIPESEAWLHENATARQSVRRGLAQARAGKFVKGPDLDADGDLAAELED